MSNFDMTEQEANQALLSIRLMEEAARRAFKKATEEQLNAVTKYIDGKEVVAVGDLLSEKEYESLVLEISKEWGVTYGI